MDFFLKISKRRRLTTGSNDDEEDGVEKREETESLTSGSKDDEEGRAGLASLFIQLFFFIVYSHRYCFLLP